MEVTYSSFFLIPARSAKNMQSKDEEEDSGFASRENGDLEAHTEMITKEQESEPERLDPANSQLVPYDENVDLNGRPFTTSTPMKPSEHPVAIPGTTLRQTNLGEFLHFHDARESLETMDISEVPSQDARMSYREADDKEDGELSSELSSGLSEVDEQTRQILLELSSNEHEDDQETPGEVTQEKMYEVLESSDSEDDKETPSKVIQEKMYEVVESSDSEDDKETPGKVTQEKMDEGVESSESEDEQEVKKAAPVPVAPKVALKAKLKECTLCKKSTKTLKGGFYTEVTAHQITRFEKCSQTRDDGVFASIDNLEDVVFHKKCYRAYVNPRACEKYRKDKDKAKAVTPAPRVTRSQSQDGLQPLVEHTLKYLKRKRGIAVKMSEVTRSFGGRPLNSHLHNQYIQRLRETQGLIVNRDMENRLDPLLRYKN